jgi:hypothetical protein
MTDSAQTPRVNSGYAATELARALRTAAHHAHAATRARAQQRVVQWEAVLHHIVGGSLRHGTRTPLDGIPAWATPEVVTGGFATGALLAGGPLQEHELALCARLDVDMDEADRRALNMHFLTDAGLAELQDVLRSGCYDVQVPEEGALLVVAWLLEHDHVDAARALLDAIAPFFASLRFYPLPRSTPRRSGTRVHRQDVAQTRAALEEIAPHPGIVAQQRAVAVWLPLYDRMVALFLETVHDDWPCRAYPDGWAPRALALLAEYDVLKEQHPPCRKFENPNAHRAQLRGFLARCAHAPASLSGREVGRIRHILRRYLDKHGAPGTSACQHARQQQAADVGAPRFDAIARVVSTRLQAYPADDGVDDLALLKAAVNAGEALATGVTEGTLVPPSIRAKVMRCLNETIDELIAYGLIPSCDVLAQVLPQMTSGIRAAGIADPPLRQLYGAIYRAFRRRRSLLLLDLNKQVQIAELPWVQAIDAFRTGDLSSAELARQTLEEIAVVALTAFPHALLPNTLVRELAALVRDAGLDIPLVEELAADIFMGAFSDKFIEAAYLAAGLLSGSLYAIYYGIDYTGFAGAAAPQRPVRWRLRQPARVTGKTFAAFCAARAGAPLGTWSAAANGMIIEQQQIVTTQNLAALLVGLNLAPALGPQLQQMARRCFTWICRRQQTTARPRHARLIMVKNTAYAWRQMVFFLALMRPADVAAFLRDARARLAAQPPAFQRRFEPAMQGLELAAAGVAPGSDAAKSAGARQFTGWSTTSHWLLADS